MGSLLSKAESSTDTVETYIDHARSRVESLRAELQASSTLQVIIAGENGSPSLGRGVAIKQWQRRFGKDASERFLAELESGLHRLAQDFPDRVSFGTVSGAAASPEHVMVWGANARNWRLPEGAHISGSGQAAAMGVQRPGVFGIVTTPKYPLQPGTATDP